MPSFSDRRIFGNVLGALEHMAGALKARWRQWVPSDRYRPEKHYMRGPGPKNTVNPADSGKPGERDPKTPDPKTL